MRRIIASALLLSASHACFASALPGSAGAVLSAMPQPPAPSVAAKTPGGEALMLELKSLQAQRGAKPADEQADLRMRALRDEAVSFGMRTALAWRYGEIESMLRRLQPQVDQVFSFAPLLIDDLALPPIVSEFRDGYRLDGTEVASSTAVAYRIEHPARLIANPPTWRDFLIQSYSFPEKPHDQILPSNKIESAVWAAGIEQGWAQGALQAERIFNANLALLQRSLQGMIVFHRLMREGVVDRPVVSQTEQGITIDAKSLDVGRIIYRIPSQPGFRKPEHWTPRMQNPIQRALPR